MKKAYILLVALYFMHNQLHATVKTFINNSTKEFFIRVYDDNNKILMLNLAPGAIQDLFIPCETINKIVVIDGQHKSSSLSALSHNELQKDKFPINKNMIFIINQNSSVKMYKGTTSRDNMLQEIDKAYMKKTNLPTIDLSIHTIQSDQPWTTQEVIYNLKHKTSFLGSIESLFSQK